MLIFRSVKTFTFFCYHFFSLRRVGIMKKNLFLVVICIICSFLLEASVASTAELSQKIVTVCTNDTTEVFVTYPVIDTIGPGFGSTAVDLPRQIGTVIRRACFNEQNHVITGWFNEYPQGFHEHYGGDEEELPETLSLFNIDPKRDHITDVNVHTKKEGSTAPPVTMSIYHRFVPSKKTLAKK